MKTTYTYSYIYIYILYTMYIRQVRKQHFENCDQYQGLGDNEILFIVMQGYRMPGGKGHVSLKTNGTLMKFCLRAQYTPKIGELVMYFNGGTLLQILLGALGNSNGGSPRPSTQMSTESPLMIVFQSC